jgi:hypothetical protein
MAMVYASFRHLADVLSSSLAIAGGSMVHLLPMLSVPLHQLQLVPGIEPCPLMFTLLEMIMRSSTASGSTRLQALHLLTCLTHPSVYPPAAVAAQSWGATLPLLGAVVTSSKVFKTTNWGFKSLAVASKLMVILAYQIGVLAGECKDGQRGSCTSEECRSLELQQEGLAWAARHCLFTLLTSSLNIAELLGSLLDNHTFWEAAAAGGAANLELSKHTEGPAKLERAVEYGMSTSSAGDSCDGNGSGGYSSGNGKGGNISSGSCGSSSGNSSSGGSSSGGGGGNGSGGSISGCDSSDNSSSSSSVKLQPLSMVAMELVSEQPKHGHLMRKASTGALAAQLGGTLREETGPDGCKYLLLCGRQSEEVVQHAVESLGSAVQEYGIVQVLQTLGLAKQLPGWSEPSAGARQKAFRFWDYFMKEAIGGAQQAEADILQLEGFDGTILGGALTLVVVAISKVLPDVVGVVTGMSQPLRDIDASSSAVRRQHAAVANKLKHWQKGTETSGFEILGIALSCKNICMDMMPVSFCCCNPACTSLQGVSELGLVFKAEGASTSSSRQEGCRPIGGGVCSGCGLACYCSRKCQRQHWAAGHKEVCGSFSSLGC